MGRASNGKRAGDASDALNGLLSRLIAPKHIPHAVVAIESGDRSFRWIGAAAEAGPSGGAVREDTPFFLASVTKLYIAVAILKLCERGHLGLDEPIVTYLPRTLIGGLHRWGGVDHTDQITIRHLLAHTSGLPDYLEERPKGGRSLLERVLQDGDRSWDIDEVARIVRDQLRPHFPPQPSGARRQKARYSDTNYRLLIAVIEVLTARPIHSAFEELLFQPLKLQHTWHPAGSPLSPGPEPAALWFDAKPLDIPLAIRSSGDLYSTAGDALRFLRALVRGEVFDDPAMLGSMQQRWNRFGLRLRAPGWPIEYGLGVMRFHLPRIFTPFHSIPALIGHTGSTGSWLFHCPQRDLFLAGTVDQVTAGPVPYRFVPRLLWTLERLPLGSERTSP